MSPYAVWTLLHLGHRLLRAARFLLFYDGGNQAFQCLQMRIMGWDVNIVHLANDYLIDAGYWSRGLDSGLCYDPTLKEYIWLISTIRLQSTSLSDLPILPRNMPYYRGLQVKVDPPTLTTDNDNHQRLLVYSVLHSHSAQSTHVSNHPVQFVMFDNPFPFDPGHSIWYNN